MCGLLIHSNMIIFIKKLNIQKTSKIIDRIRAYQMLLNLSR